jgi:hypothetical protein
VATLKLDDDLIRGGHVGVGVADERNALRCIREVEHLGSADDRIELVGRSEAAGQPEREGVAVARRQSRDSLVDGA